MYMLMMRHDITDLHFSGRFGLPEYDRRLLMMHPAVLLTLFKRVQFFYVCCRVLFVMFFFVVTQPFGELLLFSQRTSLLNGHEISSERNLK